MWLEVYSAAAVLVLVALWVPLRKLPVSTAVLAVSIAVILLGGFRPFGYNSDTRNYFSYLYTLSFVRSADILFLTKLEPIHSGMIFFIREFRTWYLAEAAMISFGIFLSYRKRTNDASFIVLCAFILTLHTSSLRYCSALAYFYYLNSRQVSGWLRAVRMTAMLSCLHVSMLLSGALASRRMLVYVVIFLGCLLLLFQSSLLGNRVALDMTEASRGLKTVAISLAVLGYALIRARKRDWPLFASYLGILIGFYAISSTLVPTFNRFMIITTLVLVSKEWPEAEKDGTGSGDIYDRAYCVLLASAVLLPYALTLPRLYFSGLW